MTTFPESGGLLVLSIHKIRAKSRRKRLPWQMGIDSIPGKKRRRASQGLSPDVRLPEKRTRPLRLSP